jgi:hypothetical protein
MKHFILMKQKAIRYLTNEETTRIRALYAQVFEEYVIGFGETKDSEKYTLETPTRAFISSSKNLSSLTLTMGNNGMFHLEKRKIRKNIHMKRRQWLSNLQARIFQGSHYP